MKKTLIIYMFLIILLLNVAFALFSEKLKVVGTANITGFFQVLFEEVEVLEEFYSTDSKGEVLMDGTLIELVVPALQKPGSYTIFEISVKNSGTIDTILEDIEEFGFTNDENIKISYNEIYKNMELEAGSTKKFNLKIEWLEESTSESNNVEFSLVLKYRQKI